MKEKFKNKIPYILTFVFFCIILTLAPITGDDWSNYGVGEKGLKFVLSAAKGMYFDWEGRFISRIFIYVFTYYKFMFVIVTSGLLTLFVYLANKIIGKVNNKLVYFLPFLALLLVNVHSFSQSYTWIAGSITYLYPAIISLAYFYYLYQKKEFKFKWFEYIILLGVNIVTPMFVENIGLAFVIGNIVWLITKRKENKIELVKFSILTLFSIGAIGLMLASPGTAARTAYEPEFYSMSFIGRMLYNIPNLIDFAFARNIIVLGLMLVAIIIALKKLGWKKYQIALFSIIPVLGIFQNIYLMIPFHLEFDNYINLWDIFSVNSWYFIFYWIAFALLFFYSIIKNIDDEQKRNFLLFLTFIAACAIGSMLAAPIWGERVGIFTELILIIVSLTIIKDYFNPKFNKAIYPFIGIVVVYFLMMFSLIFVIEKDRDKYIAKQLKDGETKEIEVYDQYITYIWTRNPWGDYHRKVFKGYYGIDEDTYVTLIRHKLDIRDWN